MPHSDSDKVVTGKHKLQTLGEKQSLLSCEKLTPITDGVCPDCGKEVGQIIKDEIRAKKK